MNNFFKKFLNKNRSTLERDSEIKLEREKVTSKISAGMTSGKNKKNVDPISLGATNSDINPEEIQY